MENHFGPRLHQLENGKKALGFLPTDQRVCQDDATKAAYLDVFDFLDKNHDSVITLAEMVKVCCPSKHLLACVAASKHIFYFRRAPPGTLIQPAYLTCSHCTFLTLDSTTGPRFSDAGEKDDDAVRHQLAELFRCSLFRCVLLRHDTDQSKKIEREEWIAYFEGLAGEGSSFEDMLK